MKKTKVTKLVKEDKRSYGIKVETFDDKFIIPVVDVRDGEKERSLAGSIIKNRNIQVGSKYFSQSFSIFGYSYNLSMKNK